MTKELEIEYKNMLDQQEYSRLLKTFDVKAEEIQTQTNHYFDTKGFDLKAKRCALRIRVKDENFECTLKTPAPEGNFEITDSLTAEQAQNMLEGVSFHAPEISAALDELGVGEKDLERFGSLTTHRIEFSYKDGLLVIDHSEYGESEDYEVEFEVQNAERGRKQFLEFLKEQDIPLRPADKKIARFMKSIQS
ncbi:CYTH domain-containing protein [Planococcus ruber]|uniref:CYTH domain-containing protein n=1 Tax=Planococcus ruber TaxID=2027871 RepID=UPI001FEFB15E|nr:CYTH domain-containing protein [Planococcus ruber]MCJ1907037.1 CYTH domain-containing protein [Planococcus ruber]